MGLPESVFAVLAFVLGAVIGSFLNVCIYRLPLGKSIVFPPSHCPNCDYKIAPYDNIPILSYLMLRGKCRGCGTRISPQYPVVEFLTGLLALMLFIKFGLSLEFAVFFFFSAAMVVITFIDLEHQIIPDVISLPGIIIGFAASFFMIGVYSGYLPAFGEVPRWVDSLIGIVVGGGSLFVVAWTYELITKNEGMGGGDVKLLAMMGAFLGWKAIPFIIFFGSLIGSVIGVTLILIKKKDGKYAIPFGPFLAFSAILFIFCGNEIIAWYLGFGGPGDRGMP